jgi:hypothetical protein
MIRIQIDLQIEKEDPTYKEVEQHLYEILLNRKLVYKSILPGDPGYWDTYKVKDDDVRDD